jgi:hypothetical protein
MAGLVALCFTARVLILLNEQHTKRLVLHNRHVNFLQFSIIHIFKSEKGVLCLSIAFCGTITNIKDVQRNNVYNLNIANSIYNSCQIQHRFYNSSAPLKEMS